MMNEDTTSTDLLTADIAFLIYLRHRDEPINFNATLRFAREHLADGDELNCLMELAASHVRGTIDVVREHRLILSDRNFNKSFFLTEEIQAVSILAPSEETLQKILEGEE